MARYTEWTAISYLTNSIYGRCSDATHCTEVTINNNSNYYTGNAGDSISAGGSTTTNAYNTVQGMTASTTGNITGVYDMSGGVEEFVMGVATNVEELMELVGYFIDSSGFSSTYEEGIERLEYLPDNKYYDSFKLSGVESGNYDDLVGVNGIEGDYRGVFKELMIEGAYSSSMFWYRDSGFAISVNAGPWFLLGGNASINIYAGIFSSEYNYGTGGQTCGSRAVLIAQK